MHRIPQRQRDPFFLRISQKTTFSGFIRESGQVMATHLRFEQRFSLFPTDKSIFPYDLVQILLHCYHHASGTIHNEDDIVANRKHVGLPETKNNAVSALGVFPFYILIRASDAAAPTFMTAFIADMHADLFPLVNFRRTEDRAQFVRTLGHADIRVHDMQVGLRICLEADQILLLFNRRSLRLSAHYFITFQAESKSRAIFSLSPAPPMSFQIFFCFSRLGVPSIVNI